MKTETNVEFVTRVMDSNPMLQMVIIQALFSYTEQVVKNEAEFRESMKGNPIVSAEGWINATKELKAELDKKYPQRK